MCERMFVKSLIASAAVAAVLGGVARPSEGGAPPERYVVKPGDTLWAIAASRYGGDTREAVWQLREHNGAAATTLEPGETLVLP